MRSRHWILYLCISLGILATTAITLAVTFTSFYQKYVWKISVTLSLVNPITGQVFDQGILKGDVSLYH